MKEQLISFETAKLAREKRFDFESKYFYTDNFGLCHIGGEGDFLYNSDGDYLYDCNGEFEFGKKYYTPTQSLLQKWLREIHKIDISLALNQFGYGYMYAVNNIKTCTNIKTLKGGPNNKFTYEEALEQGLQEALKLI